MTATDETRPLPWYRASHGTCVDPSSLQPPPRPKLRTKSIARRRDPSHGCTRWAQRFSMSFETARPLGGAAEVHDACGEDLGSPGSRVVRHLGRLTWAESVRDPREDARALRRAPRLRVDLDAVLAEAGAVPEPGTVEEPRCHLGADDDVGLVRVPVVVPADVLSPGEARPPGGRCHASGRFGGSCDRGARRGRRSCWPRGTRGSRRGRGSASIRS